MITILNELLQVLEGAIRQGTDNDIPEGSRYVQISDTLIKELCTKIRFLQNHTKLISKEDQR